MSEERRLAGRVAIITGAGSGIGYAIAGLFERHGARIVAVDNNAGNLDALRNAADDLSHWRFVEADVRDVEACERTVAQTVDEWGGIDVLVASAAISAPGKLPETDPDLFDRAFGINVKGPYVWMRGCIPAMVARERGSIITFASQLALAGGRRLGIYTGTKGALISMTQTVALDHAADGIRANILVPGAIDTPGMQDSFNRNPDGAAARERSLAHHALGRFGRPDEVALAALYLASDESSFTTGSQLYVDGGWHIS